MEPLWNEPLCFVMHISMLKLALFHAFLKSTTAKAILGILIRFYQDLSPERLKHMTETFCTFNFWKLDFKTFAFKNLSYKPFCFSKWKATIFLHSGN